MIRNITFSAFAAFLLAAAPGALRAQTITQWNFNSATNDGSASTGTTAPAVGIGTVTLIGGTTSTFAGGSPNDPNTTDNSALNLTTFPAATVGSGTAGAQFSVSTLSYSGSIQIGLDFRESATVSRFFQLQLSTDGTNFVNASGGVGAFASAPSPSTNTTFTNAGLFSNNSGSGSQAFVLGITYTLPANSAYANDANFAFRWVAVFDPANNTSYTGSNSTYSTSGTARFDLVTVAQVVPEPSTYALLLLAGGGLLLVVRRRANEA